VFSYTNIGPVMQSFSRPTCQWTQEHAHTDLIGYLFGYF